MNIALSPLSGISWIPSLLLLHGSTGPDQHQSALVIWKSSNRLCTALDFPIDSFRGIVGSDSIPVFARIVHIC